MIHSDLEHFAFLYLCSAKDRDILNGKATMTFSDFERLTYIAEFLGLTEYSLTLWEGCSSKFLRELEMQEETYTAKEVCLHNRKVHTELKKREQWIQEFCRDIPDKESRLKIETYIYTMYREKQWM